VRIARFIVDYARPIYNVAKCILNKDNDDNSIDNIP